MDVGAGDGEEMRDVCVARGGGGGRQKWDDELSRAGYIVLALLRSDNIYRSEDTLIPRMFSHKDALFLCASSTLELGPRLGQGDHQTPTEQHSKDGIAMQK